LVQYVRSTIDGGLDREPCRRTLGWQGWRGAGASPCARHPGSARAAELHPRTNRPAGISVPRAPRSLATVIALRPGGRGGPVWPSIGSRWSFWLWAPCSATRRPLLKEQGAKKRPTPDPRNAPHKNITACRGTMLAEPGGNSG